MNLSSNASPFDPQRAAPAPMTLPRPIYWSVMRELWENRFIVIAPIIVTAFVLLGSFISVVSTPARMGRLGTASPEKQRVVLLKPFHMAPAPIMLATFLIGFVYSLDALYGERRDRSILFWKSLPVSDRTVVLSKAAIPLAVLPLIAFALSVFVQVVLIILTTPFLVGSGVSPGPLFGELRFFQGLVIMFYGLAVHTLWFSPIYGWLILISAWAKRAAVVWAVIPLIAVVALERMAFNTSHFVSLLKYRVAGPMTEAFAPTKSTARHGNFDQLSELDPARFLTRPGLWLGLMFAAMCLIAAIRLRRNREPL